MQNSNKFSAFYTIFNLISRSCAIEISEEELKTLIKTPRKLKIFLEEEGKKVSTFPLQSLIKSSKIELFKDFFKTLVVLSEDNPESLGQVIEWTAELSYSNMRNMRLTIMWVVSGLIQGYTKLCQTYYDKLQSHSASSREIMKQEKKLTERKVSFTQARIEELLSKVLLVRCSDVLSDIRLIVLRVFEHLLLSNYSTDLFKPLLELSKDPKTDVRLGLLALLSKVKGDLLQSFTPRIIEMCFDLDDKCSAAAIKICKSAEVQLTELEENKLQQLIWSESKIIRNAAAEFVVSSKFHNALPQAASDAVGVGLDQNKILNIEKALLVLVEYFKDNSPSLLFSDHFVEMLWTQTSAIRSCEVMCELLSRGCGRQASSTPLEFDRKIILLCFIESNLKFLAKDEKNKAKMAGISSLLFAKLADLITYYADEEKILLHLVKLPCLVALSSLASNDLKGSFLNLLNVLSSVFERCRSLEILKYVSKALTRFAGENHPLKKDGQAELAKNIEIITSKMNNFLPQISAMIEYKDLTDDIDIKILKSLESTPNLPSEVATHFMFFWHLWTYRKVIDSPEKESDYLKIRDRSLNLFTSVMEKEAYYPSSLSSFTYLCETIFIFSDNPNQNLRLALKIQDPIWQAIEKYMIYMYLPTNPQEDSADSEKVCICVSRLIIKCSIITTSHLCSSFVAFFGRSKLLRISAIVKQVLQELRIRDEAAKGIFHDRKLLFSIAFQAITKVVCSGTEENIEDMKELCKKLAVFLPNDKNQGNSGRYKKFISEIIDFSYTDPNTLAILETLTIFVNKNTMVPNDIEEVYDHVKYYSKGFPKSREPVLTVVNHLKKIVKVKRKDDEVNDEEKSETEEFVAPKNIRKSSKPVGKPERGENRNEQDSEMVEEEVLGQKEEKENVKSPVGMNKSKSGGRKENPGKQGEDSHGGPGGTGKVYSTRKRTRESLNKSKRSRSSLKKKKSK